MAVLMLLAPRIVTSQSTLPSPPHPTRLHYSLSANAADCPGEFALRTAVSARLGYDPFTSDARTIIETGIQRIRRSLRGSFLLVDARGHRTGTRTIVGRVGHCDDLVAAMGLAVSIAVDPMSIARTWPAPSSSPPSTSRAESSSRTPSSSAPIAGPATLIATSSGPARAPPTSSARPAPIARRSLRNVPTWALRFGLGADISYGVAPALTPGFALYGELRRNALSVALEARTALPRTTDSLMTPGRVTVAPALVSLAGCYHLHGAGFCAIFMSGFLIGSGTQFTAENVTAWVPVAAAGTRVTWEIPIVPALAVRARADAAVWLARPVFLADGATAWESPTIAASAGLDVVVRFR